MKKLFSLFLVLALCLSVCCAGIAEDTAPADEEAGYAMFLAMMQMIPGMDQIDWAAFEEEYKAKVASGAEITLEDCLPAGAWQLFGAMQYMDENGQIPEDLSFTIDTIVNGNEMFSIYTMKEQVSEEDAQKLVESVAGTFETPESMANLKISMEQMAEGGIDISKVVMGLKFLNADGSVIYDKSYTDADLAAAVEPAA